MLLKLSDEQSLLHETTMRFVQAQLPLSATRSLHDDPVGFDPAWLLKAGDLGWFAMLVGEEEGGGSVSGQGLIDATIVAEELGRNGQPGPFIPMNIVASAISKLGSEEQRTQYLPGIVSGATVATWAWADRGGEWDSGASLAAVADGDNFCLHGQRGFVLDACSARVILVVAQMEGSRCSYWFRRTAPVSPLQHCIHLTWAGAWPPCRSTRPRYRRIVSSGPEP
jgi:alkylation response protein AidB-like acyl-CoA dehydrogenase